MGIKTARKKTNVIPEEVKRSKKTEEVSLTSLRMNLPAV
jgi:hypothetical protein